MSTRGGVTRPAATTANAAQRRKQKLRRMGLAALCVLAAAFGSLGGLLLVQAVDLPEVAELERYRPSTTTELYDIHGELVGSLALERRIAVSYEGFAPVLREAVISIEDKGFEHHWGVNVFRVLGAAVHDLRSNGRAQGASTLTMQLARNLFLSNERTAGRKLQETLLSIQIERTFTKQQIFTMYGNQIYLGRGVYGFEAGAEFFFSKHARELTLPEAALLAGLPKGPEEFSPLAHPERALRRRNQVLEALADDGRIRREEAAEAEQTPLELRLQPPPNTDAPWFVEEVRRELDRQLGVGAAHGAGLRVYTSLDMNLQRTANRALAEGLGAYERRQGWRGRLVNLRAQHVDPDAFRHPDWAAPPVPGQYIHAVVDQVGSGGEVRAHIGLPANANTVLLGPADWAWTGHRLASEILRPADVIEVKLGARGPLGWHATFEEDTGAEGAVLAMDNATGQVLAMVGGRDFALSQYNRATEAERQVGSSFKPYVYTAAVEAGATPEAMILDAPTSFATGTGRYTPHDFEGNTLGAITLEKAFADSRNIPAVALASEVGMAKVAEVAHRFGITSRIPPYLPVALGAVEISLREQVAAYAAFPNDGVRVSRRLIRRVTDADGMPVLLQAEAPGEAPAASPGTARTMVRFLRAVTAPGGTGAEAAALNHPVGGKTGTTTGFTDAWFLGFSPSVTCGVWVGYDNRVPLGEGETGARAALPIWIDVLRAADEMHPNERFPGQP